MAATTKTRKTSKASTTETKPRFCRWMQSRQETFRGLVEGRPVYLLVVIGDVSTIYEIALDDEGKWWMSYMDPDMSGIHVYGINLNADRACDCPAAKYRPGQECKHRLALRAALRWLEQKGGE